MHTDPDTLLPLKPLEFSILIALIEEELYGYALARRLGERSFGGVQLSPGNLYHVLDRMIGNGLLKAVEREEPEDARRRWYGPTAFGRSVAAAEATRMREVLQTAERLAIIGEGKGS